MTQPVGGFLFAAKEFLGVFANLSRWAFLLTAMTRRRRIPVWLCDCTLQIEMLWMRGF